jgi:hypothetical protein
MPELGLSGSVRGAPSNGRPYREQFSFEMGFARVGLMSPAPGRPCEDVGVRDAPLS